MYFYPGGTINNPDSIGYDFFRNFLSQLGRTKAYITDDYGNQLSNLISFRIWTSGMGTTGLIFLIYYLFLHFNVIRYEYEPSYYLITIKL